MKPHLKVAKSPEAYSIPFHILKSKPILDHINLLGPETYIYISVKKFKTASFCPIYGFAYINSSCSRNLKHFGNPKNGGKKCAHSFEVPITFLELF